MLINLNEFASNLAMEEDTGIVSLIDNLNLKELLEKKDEEFSNIEISLKNLSYLTKLDDQKIWENYREVIPLSTMEIQENF
jgi:hypothetical protein